MKRLSNTLQEKINQRIKKDALRSLNEKNDWVDFSSNDYLGFSESEEIYDATHQYLIDHNLKKNGATGSRLLSGNHSLYTKVEQQLCKFHKNEAALIFNSGYDANVGFFSSVPQRGDIILYDEYVHASIRDGIQLSNAKAYKFKHNLIDDLKEKIPRYSQLVSASNQTIYVVTESVFSMDGDSPDLVAMLQVCQENNANFIIDEAHAVGVFGAGGCGLTQELGIEQAIFARIITFGKALGCHGATILGSTELIRYLVNFARSFVYTTALPPHALATIKIAYDQLIELDSIQISPQKKLNENIQFFKTTAKSLNIKERFIESNSAIQCCIVSGTKNVKRIAHQLQEKGFDVKPILSPTIAEGQERLRFCLHSFNSEKEIQEVLNLLSTFVDKDVMI